MFRNHFKTAWQVDRVLQARAFAVIRDFLPPTPYKNPYAHSSGLHSFKMNWSAMLMWHPSYQLVSRTYTEHSRPFTFAPDECVVLDVLRKDCALAFPDRPPAFAR